MYVISSASAFFHQPFHCLDLCDSHNLNIFFIIEMHVVLIGCPKLDAVDYTEKLTEIIKFNDFKSLTIVRMEVPCCGGLEHAATEALKASGKFIPWQVVTIGIDGSIKEN